MDINKLDDKAEQIRNVMPELSLYEAVMIVLKSEENDILERSKKIMQSELVDISETIHCALFPFAEGSKYDDGVLEWIGTNAEDNLRGIHGSLDTIANNSDLMT